MACRRAAREQQETPTKEARADRWCARASPVVSAVLLVRLVLAKVRFDACGESSVQVGRRQDLVLSSHARGKMMTPFKISLSA